MVQIIYDNTHWCTKTTTTYNKNNKTGNGGMYEMVDWYVHVHFILYIKYKQFKLICTCTHTINNKKKVELNTYYGIILHTSNDNTIKVNWSMKKNI